MLNISNVFGQSLMNQQPRSSIAFILKVSTKTRKIGQEPYVTTLSISCNATSTRGVLLGRSKIVHSVINLVYI